MDQATTNSKADEEAARHARRRALRELNASAGKNGRHAALLHLPLVSSSQI
jgi:hypothetical protein